MARSLAFWFDESSSNIFPEIELHINYWSLDTNEMNYLDIGVRLRFKTASDFENLNLFIPFAIDHTTYLPQLGNLVCSERELISAIFNSNVTTTTANAKNDIFEIVFSAENRLNFYTQILPKHNEVDDGVKVSPFIEYGNAQKGTVFSFPKKLISSLDNGGDNYFRFRIKLNDKSKHVLGPEYTPKDSLLTNYFESTEMVDFRINEPRNLPATIRSNLNENFALKAVHFFLIRNANSEFKMSHSKYKRCRILENDIWKKYLELGTENPKLPEQMLIYHWAEVKYKKEEIIEHFSAFAKFTKRKVGAVQLINVFLFIFIIGVLSGLVTNFIWTFNDDSVTSVIDKDVLNQTVPIQDPELEELVKPEANTNKKDNT